jgi:branched-chain amino acid aminotransferase
MQEEAVTKTQSTVVYLDGELVPYEQATVHVMTPAMKYGAAVYEGIRAYWNGNEEQLYVFRLQEHAHRLRNSIKAMRMDRAYHLEDLCEAVRVTLRANRFTQDLHIRQSVYVNGPGPLGAKGPVAMVVVPVPKGRFNPLEGLNLCVSSWTRISDRAMPPRIKCTANYHNGRLAQLQAEVDGYDAPLLLDEKGKVTEAPTASFFLIRDGIPITCPLTSSVLESITRDTLIRLFKEKYNIDVVVREIDRTELYVADEAFICGSGAEVASVASIDRHLIGDGSIGPLTKAIQETYLNIVRGSDRSHLEWRTAIY